MRRIFSFYIVSQIGYIIMGLGLFTVAGLAGAVFAIVHHIVVKTTLFLVGGLVEHHGGSSRLHRLGGMAAATPVLAVLFLLPALSLAGIPPFSGFAAKFGLFDATARAHEWAILAVAVLVSLLTLFSIFKIWIAVFWRPRPKHPAAIPLRRAPALMVVPTAVLAVLTLAIGLGAGPLYRLSDRAADRPRRPHRVSRRRARGGRTMTSIGAVVALAVIWVLLWGTASPANILSGLVVGTLLVLVVPGLRRRRGTPRMRLRPIAIARLVGYMIVMTLRSNVELTRDVLSPASRRRTAIVGVPLPGCSDEVLTLISNLLALSPGTMPIEIALEPHRALRPRAPPERHRRGAQGHPPPHRPHREGLRQRPRRSPSRPRTWRARERDHRVLRRAAGGPRAVPLGACCEARRWPIA